MVGEVLQEILPLLNALGLPLLGTAVLILVRAYRQSAETYEQTSSSLRTENERLRTQLTVRDTQYFGEVDRMKATTASALRAVEEIQASKAALLSGSSSASKEDLRSDIENLNRALEQIGELTLLSKEMDLKLRDVSLAFDRRFNEATTAIAQLADRIGDTRSRVALIGVLGSPQAFDRIRSVAGASERGLILAGSDSEIERILALAAGPQFEEVASDTSAESGAEANKPLQLYGSVGG